MKKSSVLYFLLVSLFLLAGCNESNSEDTAPKFTFDQNIQYTGFQTLPTVYTIEEATKDGYLVNKDLKIIANEDLYSNFIETSSRGKNTSIRLIKFFTNESSKHPFYTDIFYEEGFYYSFDSSAPTQEKEPYQFLLALKGKIGNPLMDSGFIVLTSDETLTFDQVILNMISSSMRVKENIPKHQIILFQ